jgi:hypothetical protein
MMCQKILKTQTAGPLWARRLLHFDLQFKAMYYPTQSPFVILQSSSQRLVAPRRSDQIP